MTTRSQSLRRGRAGALALAALLGASVLSSCSDGSDESPSIDVVADTQSRDRASQDQAQERRQNFNDLPDPTAGVVQIDGNDGSLTETEVRSFNNSGTATDTRLTFGGEDAAFRKLCSGQIDIVDSSREISEAEWAACQDNGLDVVQFQVASDAVVVAIKNETDVGGDCLSRDQVREIYRAGSPITQWSQVGEGYDEVQLSAGGPNEENAAFTFFGQNVLDAPDPARTNLRSDYRIGDTDQGSRLWVVGRDRDQVLADTLRDRSRRRDLAKSQLESQWQVVNDAKAEVEVAEAEVAKGIRDGRSASDQAADRARLDAARVALENARQRMFRLTERKQAAATAWKRAADARKAVLSTRGNVAYFRFSYYELFEEQLRPFEITTPEGERNCIFPSQQTITSGEYPLARRMLLTTTQRSLERNEVAEFLLYYLKNAEDDATRARLVSVPAADIEVQKAWVTGDSEPVFVELDPEPVVTTDEQPSTSLQPAR